MWMHCGGVAMVAVVCGALLAAAQPQLGQHLQEDSTVNAEVFECLARYMGTAPKPGVLLVHTNHADVARYVASVRSTLTIINGGFVNITAGQNKVSVPVSMQKIIQQTYSLVVVLVAAEQELRILQSLLMHDIYKNSPLRYLVVNWKPTYKALSNGIFHVARIFSLYNIVALTWKDTHVYGCYPPGGALCHKPWPIKKLGQCQWLSLDQLYLHKEPIHYAGCKPELSVRVPVPCVLNKSSLSEQPLVAGYEVALANIISRRLNMSKYIRGHYFNSPCDSAYPYYTDTVRWYVPVAGPRAQWKGVVRVFQAPLWFTILTFFIFNSLTWWLAGAGGYAECVLDSLRTLLNGAVPLPRRTHRRFLVESWTLCALVLVAAYQSQLLSTLLTPVADWQPITNEQELLASDMPVDLSSVGPEIMEMSSYKQIKAHERKFRIDADKPRAVLQYGVTAKYRAREQADVLVALEDPAMHVPMCVKFGTYTSAMPPVNRMMQRLMEAGIVAKFMREVDFSGYEAAGGRKDEPLTMRHLDFAFFALLMGCALATLALLLEVVVWRAQHEWWPAFCTVVRRCGYRVRCCWRTCINSIRRWRRRIRFLRRRRAFRRRVLAQMNQ